jgi:PAS domain S-box-containing protein
MGKYSHLFSGNLRRVLTGAAMIILAAGNLSGQDQVSNLDQDSLKRVIAQTKSPADKAEQILLLGNVIVNKDPKQAREYAKEAHAIGRSIKDDKITGRAHLLSGFSYYSESEYDKAERQTTIALNLLEKKAYELEQSMALMNLGLIAQQKSKDQLAIHYFEKSIELKEKIRDTTGLGKVFLNMGNVYYFRGEYDESAEWYLKALKILKATGQEITAAKTINNIGNIYMVTGNYPKAMEYYRQGLEIRERMKDRKGIALVYNNFGSVFYSSGQHDSAIFYFNKSIEIKREFNDLFSIAGTLSNIGSIYRAKKDYTNAMQYFTEALVIREKLGNHFELASAYFNMGELLLDQNRTRKAMQYLEKSQRIGEEHSYQRVLSAVYKRFTMLYEEKGDYRKAFEYQQKYFQAKETEFKETYQKNIEQIEKFKVAEQEQINAMLKNETEIQSLQIEQDRIRKLAIAITSIIVVFFLSIIIIIIFIRFKKKSVINKVLTEKNTLITRQKELYAESLQRINASEKRFRGVFENRVAGIILFNQEGQVVNCNERAAEMLSSGMDHLEKSNIRELFYDEDIEKVSNVFSEIVNGNHSTSNVTARIIAGSKITWMNISLSAISGNISEPPLYACIMVDVNEIFRLEAESRKAKDEFESILSNISDLVFSVTFVPGEGLVNIYFSPAVTTMTGLSPEEIMKDPMCYMDIIHPQDKDLFNIAVDSIEDLSINEHKLEFRVQHRNGGIHWLQQKLSVSAQENGAFRIFGVTRDITEKKEIEIALMNSEYLYRSTIDSLTEHHIHVIDELYTIKVFNQAFQRLNETLGLPTHVIGKKIWDVFPFLGDRVRGEYQEVFRNGKAVVTNDSMVITGKEMFTETYKVPVLRNEKVTKVITIMKDITEEVKAKNALIRSEEKYREASISKDKFFSVIAHDLMSPFNALLGFSNLLYSMYEEYTDEERKMHAGRILDLSELIYKMAENLLYWSRSQTGRIKVINETVNLQKLLQTQVDLCHPLATKKHIALSHQNDGVIDVETDPNLLAIVIRNILTNAIKFTAHGGKVVVASKCSNDHIEISVSDTGIGIPGEMLEQLWSPGKIVKRQGTDREIGTGLGLMISKEFVDHLNGELIVKSVMGKGSCFTIQIPNGYYKKISGSKKS